MSTRDDVLGALRASGDAGISGEYLAGLLGVSRVAVGKHVTTLREMGYEIVAVPGYGYRLRSVPDRALPAEVAAHVRNPFWSRFEGGVETVSTNDDARALALAGEPEGVVVVAARQESGRGRLGRTWSSPEGGAYVSALLRPRVAPADAGPLALVVALGIARGLVALGVDVGLKWPNDVLADGGKLAGVLLEMSAESDCIKWVIAGFGLNVVRPLDAQPGAAYVRDLVPGAGVASSAAACLDGIAEAYAAWFAEGFEGLLEEYQSRSVLTGEHVVVSDATGAVRVQGVARGVDVSGRLLVDCEDGCVAVASGEVTLRRPSSSASG